MTTALRPTSRPIPTTEPTCVNDGGAPGKPVPPIAPAAPTDSFTRRSSGERRGGGEPLAPPRDVGVRCGQARPPSSRQQQLAVVRQALADSANFAPLGWDDWGAAAGRRDRRRRGAVITAENVAGLSRHEIAAEVDRLLAERGVTDPDARDELLAGLRRSVGSDFFFLAQREACGHIDALRDALTAADDQRLADAWREFSLDLGPKKAEALCRELGLHAAVMGPAALRQVREPLAVELARTQDALTGVPDPAQLRDEVPGALARLALATGVRFVLPRPTPPVDRVRALRMVMFGGLGQNVIDAVRVVQLLRNTASTERDTFLGDAVAARLDRAWLWQQIYELVGAFATNGIGVGAGDGLLPGDLADLVVGNGPGLLGTAIDALPEAPL